jgi:hypothetical protein
VTWSDTRNDSNKDIYAQRFSSDGTALGSNFKVNDDQGSGSQYFPYVSINESGNFVIMWKDNRNGQGDDIYAQRYASDGTASGPNIRITNDQGDEYPICRLAVSLDESGNFVIVITRYDHAYGNAYVQRYSSDGTGLGHNLWINDDGGQVSCDLPSVSIYGNGNFVITWASTTESGNAIANDIFARRYSSNGTALGRNFKVSSLFKKTERWSFVVPSIATNERGNFIITWSEDEPDDVMNIYAQRYAGDGTALGSKFKVNEAQSPLVNEYFPSIKTYGNGNFIIWWRDARNGKNDIYAQLYSSDGTALGSNFMINDKSR